MKNVVHITCVHTPQDSRIFHRECAWLAENGFQVTYVVPADFFEKPRAKVLIKGVKRPKSRMGRPLVWLRILFKVIAMKPDILHFHDPELLVLAPVLKWLRRSDFRIVYDVHEYLAASIKDKFWIPRALRKPAARLVAAAESFLGRWVDGQVFVVEGQLPYYESWKTKKIVLHNYPDQASFETCAGQGKKSDRFTLVHIGSLYERRGIMTMLKTLDILKSDGYHPLLVLGGKFESAQFKERVDRFIRERALEDHVRILGWIDYTDIVSYLETSHATWLPHYPSLQHSRESICTKQLEAMLAGLPAVVSDIPILTRFVHESGGGLAASPLAPESHARAIKYLMDHPKETAAMGKKGERLVREKYVWQKEAPRLKAFYETL